MAIRRSVPIRGSTAKERRSARSTAKERARVWMYAFSAAGGRAPQHAVGRRLHCLTLAWRDYRRIHLFVARQSTSPALAGRGGQVVARRQPGGIIVHARVMTRVHASAGLAVRACAFPWHMHVAVICGHGWDAYELAAALGVPSSIHSASAPHTQIVLQYHTRIVQHSDGLPGDAGSRGPGVARDPSWTQPWSPCMQRPHDTPHMATGSVSADAGLHLVCCSSSY